jgi:hypothetical protein
MVLYFNSTHARLWHNFLYCMPLFIPSDYNLIEVEMYRRNVMINYYLLLTVQFVGPNSGQSVWYTEQRITFIILTFIVSNFTIVEVSEASRTDWRPLVVLSIPVGSVLKFKGISRVISNPASLVTWGHEVTVCRMYGHRLLPLHVTFLLFASLYWRDNSQWTKGVQTGNMSSPSDIEI